jgi:hypothetical protein
VIERVELGATLRGLPALLGDVLGALAADEGGLPVVGINKHLFAAQFAVAGEAAFCAGGCVHAPYMARLTESVNNAILTIVMNNVDRIIAQIEDWLTEAKVSESRLGLLSCANAGAMDRIRNGTAQVQTLRQVVDYIEKNPIKRRKK